MSSIDICNSSLNGENQGNLIIFLYVYKIDKSAQNTNNGRNIQQFNLKNIKT